MMKKFVENMKKMLENLMNDKKKLLLVIGGLVVVFMLIVVLVVIFSDRMLLGGDDNLDEQRFRKEYESLNGIVNDDGFSYPEVKLSNNKMKYSNVAEIIDIFNTEGDAVIYFGFPTCVYCRSAVQVLCDTAKDTDLDVIYYLDVEDTNEKYKELIQMMGNKFTIDENGEELYAPLVIFVTNGDIVSYNKGTLFSQKSPYIKLDDSQIEGLSEIYRYGINDVLNSIQLKNNI